MTRTIDSRVHSMSTTVYSTRDGDAVGDCEGSARAIWRTGSGERE